jgi:hypothetical protein
VILACVVNSEVLRRFQPPARATPGFCTDTHTKRENLLFELTQRFAVPIRRELIVYRSEDIVHIKEYDLLTRISHKSSVLGYRTVRRGA